MGARHFCIDEIRLRYVLKISFQLFLVDFGVDLGARPQGHSSVRTTQRYAEVKQSTILNDLHRAAR